MCKRLNSPRAFCTKLIKFQKNTNATVAIIVFKEPTEEHLRNGLSHKQFINSLQQAFTHQLEFARGSKTEPDLPQTSVRPRSLPHEIYAEAVKTSRDTHQDEKKHSSKNYFLYQTTVYI